MTPTRIRTALALAGVVASLACGDLFFEARVEGRRPYAPPTVYEEWWAATEQCSGIGGSFERIDWYLADSVTGEAVTSQEHVSG